MDDGFIELTIDGKYDEIKWSTGATSGTRISELSAGRYSVTVTDKKTIGKDKVTKKSFEVREPEPLRLSVETLGEFEFDGNVVGKRVKAIIGGGTMPYSYISWIGEEKTWHGSDELNIAYGDWTVLVIDQNSCRERLEFKLVPTLVPIANNDTVYVDLTQCNKIAPLDLLANDTINNGFLRMPNGLSVDESRNFLFKIPCTMKAGEQKTIPYELVTETDTSKATLTVISVAGGLDGGTHFVLNPEHIKSLSDNPFVVDTANMSIVCINDTFDRNVLSHTELKYYLNDQYSDANRALMLIVSEPIAGKVVNDKNRMYYIAPNYATVDTIVYSVCSDDRLVCDTATVTVSVGGGNIATNDGPCSALSGSGPPPTGYISWCQYWSVHYADLITWTDAKKINCQDICGNYHHDDGEGDGKKGKKKVQTTDLEDY